ncbi:MAG: hypothetical protein Q4P72_05990 [Eubacteriales bacterium]|nr:hypothetical protein [Eubacteriales bacterium]
MDLSSFWFQLKQAFFVPTCVLCGRVFRAEARFPDLCSLCETRLPIRRLDCLRDFLPLMGGTSQSTISFNDNPYAFFPVIIACDYLHPLPQLVRSLKFHGGIETTRLMAALMSHALNEYLFSLHTGRLACRNYDRLHFDAIVAMPIHASRARERSYNQSQEIVQHLAHLLALEDLSIAISRTRATERQSELANRNQRYLNVQNCFRADPELLRDRHVILVDDVMTSGLTLASAAKSLYLASAATVTGLVLASNYRAEAA